NARSCDYVAFGNLVALDQCDGFRAQRNPAASDRHPRRQRFGRYIYHFGRAVPGNMGEPFHHFIAPYSITPSNLMTSGLPSNRDHLATRLVILPEVVLLRFAIHHVEKELPQLLISRAGA